MLCLPWSWMISRSLLYITGAGRGGAAQGGRRADRVRRARPSLQRDLEIEQRSNGSTATAICIAGRIPSLPPCNSRTRFGSISARPAPTPVDADRRRLQGAALIFDNPTLQNRPARRRTRRRRGFSPFCDAPPCQSARSAGSGSVVPQLSETAVQSLTAFLRIGFGGMIKRC